MTNLLRLGAINAIAGTLLAWYCVPARASIPTATFDSTAQGWTAIGSSTDYGPPSGSTTSIGWDTRGNPGGALSIQDFYYSTWISAPDAYLGNQSAMYGQSFSYDLFIRYTDQTSVPYPSAAISGNGLSLTYTIAAPPLNTWDRRVVTFDPALWRVGDGTGSSNPGPVATQAQLQSVLSALTGLYLLTEWRTGTDDTSVDNIGGGFATGLIGDYNHNGFVDAADYVVFRKSLGTVYTQTDYVIWRSHFGQTAGGDQVGTSAPEPTACSMLAILSVFSILHFRRKCG